MRVRLNEPVYDRTVALILGASLQIEISGSSGSSKRWFQLIKIKQIRTVLNDHNASAKLVVSRYKLYAIQFLWAASSLFFFSENFHMLRETRARAQENDL